MLGLGQSRWVNVFQSFEASCLLHLRRSAVQEEVLSNNAATKLRVTITASTILVKGQWVSFKLPVNDDVIRRT